MKSIDPSPVIASHVDFRVKSARSGAVWLLVAVFALVLAVIVFDRARWAHVRAVKATSNLETALRIAQGREQLVQQNRALLSAAEKVQKQAELNSVLPLYWGDRQINLRQQNMTRAQINSLMSSVARNRNQLFKLEDFELAVTHSEAGLFDLGAMQQLPLMVSLRGSIYFRISERAL